MPFGDPPRSIPGGGGGSGDPQGTSTPRNTQETPQGAPMGCPRAPGGSPRLIRWCFDCGHRTFINKHFFFRHARMNFVSALHSGCLLCREWSWEEARPGEAALALQNAKREQAQSRAKSPDAAAG